MFDFVSSINRDITEGIADAVQRSLGRGELGGIFDAIASTAAHQFFMLPYYFALFHQNRERHYCLGLRGATAASLAKTT